jgi:hypothetical protein
MAREWPIKGWGSKSRLFATSFALSCPPFQAGHAGSIPVTRSERAGLSDREERSDGPGHPLSFEARRIAAPDAQHFGLRAGQVDDRRQLTGDLARIDDSIDQVVEPLLDLPALRHRLLVAR